MKTFLHSQIFARLGFLLLALMLSDFMLFTFVMAAQTQSTVVWLQGPTSPVYVGDEITVTVRISDVVDLYGLQMSLNFTPTAVQVVDANSGTPGIQIKPGDCPAQDFVVQNTADNSNGTIDYAVSQLNPTPPVNGDCIVAYIRFQTQQVTTTLISFNQVILSDPNGQPISNMVSDLWLIVSPPLLEVDYSAMPTTGIAPFDVQFTNLTSGTVSSWLWAFGDGLTSTLQHPLHTYTAPGIYTVSLTAVGPGGTAIYTRTNYITAYEAVMGDFNGSPIEGVAPLNVNFTNLSTGDFTDCNWDFGDGTTSTECNDPDNLYEDPGVYTITLDLNGPGGTASITQTNYITVYDPALANFSGNPISGTQPLTVTFTNLSEGDYDTCSWDFGNGNTSNQCESPPQVYDIEGTYIVSLTVSGLGGMDTALLSDYITVYEPVTADFSGFPLTGTAPLTVTFTNLSIGDYDACHWDFGDGLVSDSCDDPEHIYVMTGTFTVTLTTSGAGGTDTLTQVEYITVYQPLIGDFIANPTNGQVPLTVQFTDISSGTIDTWFWDFGDGQTSNLQNPVHTYVSKGIYTVTLTVSGIAGSDLKTKAAYINVLAESYSIYLSIIAKP